MDKKLRLLSLFSGCGGMDLGFEGGFRVPEKAINKKLSKDFIDKTNKDGWVTLKENRFETVFANDILIDAKNTWTNYFGARGRDTSVYHLESIVDLVKKHKSGCEVFPKNIDVVTGGFPCQDFSVAGKRQGFNSSKGHHGGKRTFEDASTETRGQLYMWMKEVIDITKPKVFVAENVKGLVNLENVKDIIQHDFSQANGSDYLVLDPQVLLAANYGVSQSRERVFFIGVKKSALSEVALKELQKASISDDFNPYPKRTHYYKNDSEDSLQKFFALGDLFKDLPEPDFTDDPSHKAYSKAKFMGKHCQGQTEIRLDSIGPTIRAEHHGNIEFRRLSKNNGGKSTELQTGLNERRLTPRECGLIQSFPDDFEFVIPSNEGRKKYIVSPSKAYKVIGNAVPPLLAYHLAHRLDSLWDNYFD